MLTWAVPYQDEKIEAEPIEGPAVSNGTPALQDASSSVVASVDSQAADASASQALSLPVEPQAASAEAVSWTEASEYSHCVGTRSCQSLQITPVAGSVSAQKTVVFHIG